MWAVHGNTAEADHWLSRALDRADLGEKARIRVLLAASMVAAPAGDVTRSLTLSHEAAVLAEAAALPVHRATALLNAGVADWALGHYPESIGELEAAMVLFRAADRRRGVALTSMNLARTELDHGDIDRAGELLEEAATLADQDGDPQLRTLIACLQARRALHLGQAEVAAQLASRCLARAEALDHHETITACLHVLGRARLTGGDTIHARDLHRRALDIAAETGHVGAALEAVEALGEVAVADGDPGGGAVLLTAAAAERSRRRLPVPGSDAGRLTALRASLPSPAVTPSLREVIDDLLAADGDLATGVVAVDGSP
jgi:tetratricopeptide (TPR) repeat protein